MDQDPEAKVNFTHQEMNSTCTEQLILELQGGPWKRSVAVTQPRGSKGCSPQGMEQQANPPGSLRWGEADKPKKFRNLRGGHGEKCAWWKIIKDQVEKYQVNKQAQSGLKKRPFCLDLKFCMGAPRAVQVMDGAASTSVLVFSGAGNWVGPKGKIFYKETVL